MLLKNANILVVDDDTDVLTAMRLLLKSKVKEVVTEKNPNNIISLIRKKKFDIVVLDMNFNGLVNTGNEGIYWLNKIKEIDKDLSVILITAYGELDLAIKSLKEGAQDFLIKPWKNEKLIQSITDILKKKVSGKNKKEATVIAGVEIIGNSHVMQDVFLKVKKIAPTDANILILGENGTGKDLIAKAIHDNSLRKNKPFVKVDVGALTSTLFEGELFGHKKGAFTDAKEDRKGRFEAADGGTLFLDEIGNISLQQQARLLTALQNRHITPLGSNKPIPINIRLICATNLDISVLANEAKFRKDLIYRINTVEIMMPPLRNREKDIILLANHFIELYAEKYLKSSFNLEDGFIKKLESYYFPGNVRELQYALERAVIMADGNTLTEEDLVFSPIEKRTSHIKESTLNLEEVEKTTILKVIEKNNGNITKSAKELGITRTALYRRLNKYGL
ncbi:sigma-54-dependent transcriptional regulator [Flavivirga eckloniae]|uniref:Sigma-54-dependent Fis family transcriptional regulator n=1 Tax=Flavivirga eckloniae TaxID=1803846 RepID=A0A2K9PN39_9FLAO|nr:sigma-54 dependent transcriptional regulator [Flavivirga eckloniae]AUP78479.1 sigma-54-dependent Fis family transcriptional regulator [Flavivirga eckloniae]